MMQAKIMILVSILRMSLCSSRQVHLAVGSKRWRFSLSYVSSSIGTIKSNPPVISGMIFTRSVSIVENARLRELEHTHPHQEKMTATHKSRNCIRVVCGASLKPKPFFGVGNAQWRSLGILVRRDTRCAFLGSTKKRPTFTIPGGEQGNRFGLLLIFSIMSWWVLPSNNGRHRDVYFGRHSDGRGRKQSYWLPYRCFGIQDGCISFTAAMTT